MKKLLALWLAIILFAGSFNSVSAREGQVLGIHILHPYEITDAEKLIQTDTNADEWHYMTIPLTLEDLKREDEWKNFFQQAKEKKVIPIVRLATRFENGSWQVPNRKEITDLVSFLKKLEWPTDKKHIIVFNEVNHAKEWGGRLDPVEYAEVFKFTADWAHSEQANFVVAPAAMDLAAPNGGETTEAFTYLTAMYAADPEIFQVADIWNSHSYPNPGFSSAPERTAQNSLRGFEHELAYLKEKTGRDYQVIITETGWVANKQTSKWLEQYYTYALQHIWSHPQVLAVTPFVLRGDPGPFSGFAFLDRHDQPTLQYRALQNALKRVEPQS